MADSLYYYLPLSVLFSAYEQVLKLEESVHNLGFDVEYIHIDSVIPRDEVFARHSIDERRKLLHKMLNFVNKCPISYLTVVVDRKESIDKITLLGKLAKEINRLMSEHIEFFFGFDKIIVYYDNGQIELLKKTFLKSVEKKSKRLNTGRIE